MAKPPFLLSLDPSAYFSFSGLIVGCGGSASWEDVIWIMNLVSYLSSFESEETSGSQAADSRINKSPQKLLLLSLRMQFVVFRYLPSGCKGYTTLFD